MLAIVFRKKQEQDLNLARYLHIVDDASPARHAECTMRSHYA